LLDFSTARRRQPNRLDRKNRSAASPRPGSSTLDRDACLRDDADGPLVLGPHVGGELGRRVADGEGTLRGKALAEVWVAQSLYDFRV